VVVVFIGFVLLQRENVEQATRPSAKTNRGVNGRAQKDAEETAQTELRPDPEIKKGKNRSRETRAGCQISDAATSVARGQ